MNRKPPVKLIMILTILSLLVTTIPYSVKSIQPIYQETITVDIEGNGDYTTISEAVKNAESLNIIEIKPGLYKENTIKITKKIAIIGENPENTIIDFNGKVGFKLESTYIEIHNIKIINTKDYAISTSATADYCNISNCIIETKKPNGIDILSKHSTVLNCEIISNQSYSQGIKIQGDYNLLKGCTVHGFGEGILVLIKSDYNTIINCNTFDNEVGVDIRIGSKNNIISNCNIYGNEFGAYLWQNSKSNSIYLNNFWKNDEDAIDEDNNNWDNGVKGNYWDDYRSTDANNDGILDTPYQISETAKDRYPLKNMILPDIISAPANIQLTTSTWDNTPSFTWDSSIYRKGIKGYYIKIDSNPEKFIGDTTTWTSTEFLTNGVHTIYIQAEGTDGELSSYTSLTFSIDTNFIDTDGDGWSDEEEQQYGTDLNDPNNYPLDTDDDSIPDTTDTDDDNDGYNDNMENSYGTSTTNSNNYPLDTDDDGIPDEDSSDGKYVGDIDDDDDYLPDTTETKLGSNPKDGSDVNKLYIEGKAYYLIDANGDGRYDILYDLTSDTTKPTKTQKQNILIDLNEDGRYEYIYNIEQNTVNSYEEKTPSIDVWIPTTIVTILLFVITTFYYIKYHSKKRTKKPKTKRKTIKPQIKKPIKFYAGDRDTAEMISQTRLILQNIQQDVTTYMEKLSQIEDQIEAAPTAKTKEQPETIKEEIIEQKIEDKKQPGMLSAPSEESEPEETDYDKSIEIIDKVIIENIEEEVDKLLSKLKNEEN